MNALDTAVGEAFKRWWDEDYSWEGLSKKSFKTPGGQTSSLRDYWWVAEGELISFAGRKWTVFHLPMRSLTGDVSPKAAWRSDEYGRFLQGLNERIRRSTNLVLSSRSAHDNARLFGIVFPQALTLRAVVPHAAIVFKDCIFEGDADFSNVIFENGMTFENCTMKNRFIARETNAQDQSSFHNVIFGGRVEVQKLRQAKGLSISQSKSLEHVVLDDFSAQKLVIEQSEFLQPVRVTSGRINQVQLGETTFQADVTFSLHQDTEGFSAHDCVFGGNTKLHISRARGEMNFERNEFAGTTTLAGSNLGSVLIANSRFSGVVDLSKCTFAALTRIEAEFDSNVSFQVCRFEQEADFSDCHFRGFANFQSADFQGFTRFVGTKFGKTASFSQALFQGPLSTFRDARFGGDALFSDGGGQKNSNSLHFEGATFAGIADFSGRQFRGQTTFARVLFEGLPLFHDCALSSDTTFLRARFEWRKFLREQAGYSRGWLGKLEQLSIHLPLLWVWPKLRSLAFEHNEAAERFEQAYLKLRLLSAGHEHADQELTLYAAQMDVRRSRTDTPIFEKLVGWLFNAASGYGRFVSQPLILLVAIIWATASWMHAFLPAYNTKAEFVDVLRFTAHQFVAAPVLWTGRQRIVDSPDWAQEIYQQSPGALELVSLLAFLLTVALLGVFFISLRRRFALK